MLREGARWTTRLIIIKVVVVVIVDQGTQWPLAIRISGGRLLVRECSQSRGPSNIIRGTKDVLISKASLGVLHGEASRDPTTIGWIKSRRVWRNLLLLILINRSPVQVVIFIIGVLELTKRRGRRKRSLLLKMTKTLIGLLLTVAKVREEPLQHMTGRAAVSMTTVLWRDSFLLSIISTSSSRSITSGRRTTSRTERRSMRSTQVFGTNRSMNTRVRKLHASNRHTHPQSCST